MVENKATITVPVDASTTNQITKKVLDATLSRMLIIKTSTNEMVVRKLYYVPDYKYLLSKGYDISECMLYKTHDDFTGLLITKNWNDEVLSYHKVKNGKIEGILRKYDATAAKSNSLKQINMNSYTSAKTSGLDYELDEVVITKYKAPTTYTYVYYTQPYYSYTSPTNTYNPYGVGGGGGGGGSTDVASTPAPIPPPPSCESFNFTSKKGANWQEALIKNIHFTIVLFIPPNHFRITQIINYPQAISFGMPINFNKGNGDVTPGVAATVSAKILEKVMDDVVLKYGNTEVPELTVRLYFQEQLTKEYRTYTNGGIVNFNSTSPITATQYKTNISSTGNCD